jgi:DNA-directed RNA polymerase specialized sigma subunit
MQVPPFGGICCIGGNYMTVKEDLRQIELMHKAIKHKKWHLQRLKDEIYSLQAVDTSSFKPSNNGYIDGTPWGVADSIDLEREIYDDSVAYFEYRHKMLDLVHKLSDGDLIDILYKRYFEYKRLSLIAYEMSISDRHIRRLHGKALKLLDDIVKMM